MENGSTCSCKSGYAGNKCQYSDSVNCNDNGNVQDNRSCKCNHGYAGVTCEFSDSITCNGHGTVQNNGSCEFFISIQMFIWFL